MVAILETINELASFGTERGPKTFSNRYIGKIGIAILASILACPADDLQEVTKKNDIAVIKEKLGDETATF